jgi:hypothetical protein
MAAEILSLLRNIGLLAWLAKDLGWVLLEPVLAWPAAAIAIVTEGYLARSEWGWASAGIRIHTLAELSWLLGNCIWMSSELLFDKHGRTLFPWYNGPILEDNAKAYNIGADVSLAILLFGFLLLSGFYMYKIFEHVSGRYKGGVIAGNPQDDTSSLSLQEEDLVFGYIPEEIYKRIFLFPWIAKDIFWNLEWMYMLILFAFLVVAIALDYIRRYGGSHFWAALFWFCGNAAWACSEVVVPGPATGLRVGAAMLLSMGIACVVMPMALPKALEGEWALEREPLYHGTNTHNTRAS